MEHVLPCMYCRASLKKIRPQLDKIKFAGTFEKIWALHNAVSDKLQAQGGSGAPITLERARRRWEKSSEPVSELQLLHALIVTAGNYQKCPDARKMHWYSVMWHGIANLCLAVPTLGSLGAKLLEDAESNKGCSLLSSADTRRKDIVLARKKSGDRHYLHSIDKKEIIKRARGS